MRKASIGITPEGAPSIGLSALAAVVFAILGLWLPAVLFLCCTLFACNFFRDPERVVPGGQGLAVSPADGKVIKIARMPDPFSGEERLCMCIFMDVFSVHVNRSPVAASVAAQAYHPGRFFNAALDKASRDNERCAWLLEEENGARWTMVQIAGLIARRIVCRAEEGDVLARGERLGMIKFGSRVDLYLPDDYQPVAAVGQEVFAGQSVVARREPSARN